MRAIDPEVEQAADALRTKVTCPEVEILAARQRALAIFEEEGVALVVDRVNTEVFEAMRRRLLWSRRWRTVQSSEDVVDGLLEFMRDRPDLRGLDD